MNEQQLKALCVPPSATVREAMQCMDRTGHGIVLVVDTEGHLLATVTDGDIRRAILAGMDLDLPVQDLLARRPPPPHPTPVTAPVGTSDAQLLRMMKSYGLRHIPIVDEAGRVVDIALLSELVKESELPLTAVVMVGGYGTRLRPLTEELPKPMLPVGGRPLLELIMEQLRQAGIRRIILTTHYKGDVIAKHFGNGRDFGVEIRYLEEKQPLGTAGALGLLASNEPLLVINGDILTKVDFRTMLEFHRKHQADMTVAVRQYEIRVPYGVMEVDGVAVTNILEKPTLRYLVNAGIYLLSPAVCRLVPPGQRYDMPDLINRLLKEGYRVVSFPILEYWIDIGHPEDYFRSLADIGNGEV